MGNIRCKGCKELILDNQKRCPLCGFPIKSSVNFIFSQLSELIVWAFKFVFSVFILVCAAFFVWMVYGVLKDRQVSRPDIAVERSIESAVTKCSALAANEMAKEYVKVRIVKPSTARFPATDGKNVRVIKEGLCEFTVLSYVDSKDKDGNQVRAYTMVRLFMDDSIGEKIWRAKYVEFSDNP